MILSLAFRRLIMIGFADFSQPCFAAVTATVSGGLQCQCDNPCKEVLEEGEVLTQR